MARYLIPSDTFLKAIKPGDPRERISDGDRLVLLLFVKPASTAGASPAGAGQCT
jgi:hypothetical protein